MSESNAVRASGSVLEANGGCSIAGNAPRYGRLKVLVVEDHDASRTGLAKAVRLLGHECRSARDGLEGWELHQADPADVILSDWKMPRMDGLELCRRTRTLENETAYTYFIFLTSFDDKDHFLRGMDAGADDYHPKPVDIDELEARLMSAGRVIALYRKLGEKNSTLRHDSQMSFRAARVDPLTGIANRLRMDEDLAVLWARANRYGHRCCAAICDIDNFKKYNDRYGHLAGDDLLREVAQTIRNELRESDGFYRYGGEEFLLVLPEQPLAEAVRALERVRRAIEALDVPGPDGGSVTISIGAAELSTPTDGALSGWLRRADAALYRAKANGRNRVETNAVCPTWL